MFEAGAVFLLSCFLFCIGLIGAFKQRDLLKTFISLEISVFASIINFSYAPARCIDAEHVVILVAVILGCLTFSVLFTIINNTSSMR
jgi:NADH:ubiquinone oxidoreductase subunit K